MKRWHFYRDDYVVFIGRVSAAEVFRSGYMVPLLKEIRHNPLLWLLVFVPVVFAAQKLKPEAHTLLFVLSVLAIVPLAALLSHATESVAAKTGDTVGGLLNATLGNLTELVIALTALRAGQYMLVKASIAGAIVTNTLFMLGASFLARRTQTPRAGIQPGQRPFAGGPALPGHGRAVDPFGGLASRLRDRGGVHPETERGPGGAAHRRLRTGHAVLAQDAPRVVCQRGITARPAKRRGRSAWPWPRWPASRCWWRW